MVISTQKGDNEMKLNQPYYIEQRFGDAHIDLGGRWDFFGMDEETECFDEGVWTNSATLPNSVYYCLNEAGVLPHPYYGCNSKLYKDTDRKVWYFRRKFNLSKAGFNGNAFLCFDGISYYSKVWVNGKLIGDHEGMFGGPCADVAEQLCFDGENEIIVEVKACNYGKHDYDGWNKKGENPEIIPWNIVHDSLTSNGDFAVFGIWNNIRLELVNKMHISRPYLVTNKIDDDKAYLHLELQIADGRLKELVPFHDKNGEGMNCTNAFYSGITGKTLDDFVSISVKIKDGENVVYTDNEDVKLTDFEGLLMDPKYYELQFYMKDIEIKNPRLWYPNGLGEAHLYNVEIAMSYNGIIVDTQSFEYGIRTFSADYTKGNKYRTKCDKYLFSVNGKQIFLKGMNWTPIDYLYSIDEKKYEWCLTLAKNAGIQLIRVWNGGGFPESDAFYQICDKLGLMVWQDMYIANNEHTESYPYTVLEAQSAYNLYRTRNHPSLVILCGGNEHNPYTMGNAANMFIMKRIAEELAPDRIFYNTTPDKGSAHIYRDMEPVWYRHIYSQLPFVAESGIHSFPNFVTLKKFISEREANEALPDLSSDEFVQNYPELLNHFSEYAPSRVPRMTSRISQIGDISRFTLKDLCEASHVQCYEFYQLMIQSMHENYPVCGGIMPWVFKRPWPTVAIQTVDGDDRPTLQYYAVKNSYSGVNVCFCQKWSVLAPKEPIELVVKVFNDIGEDLTGADVSITVYNPDLTVAVTKSEKYAEGIFDFGVFNPDDSFTNTCFLISAEVSKNETVISRSVYFNKCTDELSDTETYKRYRETQEVNMYFKNGPWLKDSISNAKKAGLSAGVTDIGTDELGYMYINISLENPSDVPAYPVTLSLADESKRFFLSDNFFLLAPGEKKNIKLTCDEGECGSVIVSAWNCDDSMMNGSTKMDCFTKAKLCKLFGIV